MEAQSSWEENFALVIRSSSTTRRIEELRALREKVRHDKIPEEHFGPILSHLFGTYPAYVDRESCEEVQACLSILFETSHASFGVFLEQLEAESKKRSLAPSGNLVLVQWCSLAIRICSSEPTLWKAYNADLTLATAQLLDLQMLQKSRQSVRHSAFATIHRALRKLFRSQEIGLLAMDGMIRKLTDKSGPGAKAAVLLDAIVSAGLEIDPGMKKSKSEVTHETNLLQSVNNLKSLYCAFWAREVIGSKTALPSHIAHAFGTFFSSVVTMEDITKELVPPIEKALLRAPEVVLNDLVRPMVAATPIHFDYATVLADQLSKPLTGNLKSTNSTIRSGACSTFCLLLERSSDSSKLVKVVKDVLDPLVAAKITTTDQKALYSQILASVSPCDQLSPTICEGMSAIASKEQNESALLAEIQALAHHLPQVLLHNTETPDKVNNVFAKGIADKRTQYQRLWSLRAGEILSTCRNAPNPMAPAVTQFAQSVVPPLITIFNECIANPIPTSQSSLVVAAYVLIYHQPYLHDLLDESPVKKALIKTDAISKTMSKDDKSSFLLNYKAYSKVLDNEDISWFVRALFSCSKWVLSTSDDEKLIADAWTQACLFTVLRQSSQAKVRRESLESLGKTCMAHRKGTFDLFIRGLWIWHRHLETNTKESAAVAAQNDMGYAYMVINTLCQQQKASTDAGVEDEDDLKKQLISMLVLCRPKILPKTSWIETCLKCRQDPGELVATHPDLAISHIKSVLVTEDEYGALSSVSRAASFEAFADLAFVAPKTITPLLIEQIKEDLDPEDLNRFSATDFAIARTPEGTAYVDVLSTKTSSNEPVKGRHDYDILKWEQDLRAQLAAKRGLQKKLTTEEKSKVDAQLEKEAKIRADVLTSKHKISRGIGITHALAIGPPTDADMWLGPAVNALLALIKSGVALLIGKDASNAYIACSNLLNSRLGLLRPFIGIATIRAVDAGSSLDESFLEEPVPQQVTRVLYRLRLAGEQRPFDSVSLSYMMPLVCLVLESNGIGKLDSDAADEQITLCLEFLSSHMDIFSSTNLPRAQVIGTLIKAMQAYNLHYKLIKDSLNDICRAIAESMTTSETSAILLGTIVPQVSVRVAVLQAIREHVDLTDLNFCVEVWLACHDDEEENRAIAEAIWEENGLDADADDSTSLFQYLDNDNKALRRAAARGLAACVSLDGSVFASVLDALESRYSELAKPQQSERDAYGMVKKTNMRDPWEGRSGVALSFKELAPHWPKDALVPFVHFLIDSNALGDRNDSVRDDMIAGAIAVITQHGKEDLEALMSLFETPLEASEQDAGLSDSVNEALVILYGALSQHLESGDSRVPKVVHRLLKTLGTPSETVQCAVSGCLPPLVRTSLDHTSEYVKELLDQLFSSTQYASRRGAAYGLAGVVSGKGLTALKENRIMVTLKSAAENKKDSNQRQGAQFAFELMSLILGRTFEPYVIQIVPLLISGFGDASADVREACLDASKTCFANLSSYGVKIILPMLLEGLDETQWRSKRGACDLLGAMAYLDPQQLAQSLPDIIPPLTKVLSDSHKEVRVAANRSLQRFGEVISNPEIKALVNVLLKALSDPTKYTDDALDSLITISFVHYLDAPSLALVVRILERGLSDRSATKRKAAQIIGSLAHLTERKDITPHLPLLVAGLRTAAIDPVPTTRATSSKALGSLVEKLGEDALPDLIPSLMATLRSDAGAADRLGSAQALSEVLAGLGTGRLEETLPTILQNVNSSRPAVREGFMTLFIFLPACFGNSFANYLSRIIPPLLAGLADEVEAIRETSLRAGRLLVKNFASKAIDLLLPELDRGLADNNHRIRLSSVELVGDLLFNLTGISAEMDQEQLDDERTAVAEASHSLLEVLGEEKRNKILSSLYICRNDTSGLVRNAAITVWKALVATPRTLKELVPTLTQALIKRLASNKAEQRAIAGNALSELIKKAGEGVLATLLPTLEEGLQTSNVDNKQGICIALREIISSAAPETLEDYEKTIISVVRAALVDPNDEVRDTAAEAFDSLQQIFGKRAVDQVLPYLLNTLRTEDGADTALAALLTLLTDNTRANIILPNLVPTLLVSPMTAFNARAIASLAEVAGSTMTRRLPAVLNALMDNIIACQDESLREELITSYDSIMLNLDESDGLNTAMSVTLALIKHDDERRRSMTAHRLAKFFAHAEIDFHRYNQDLIRVLLLTFNDRDIEVVKASWGALSGLMKRLRKEEMEALVPSTRQVVQQLGVAGHNLPGFCLPKGINAILPIFLQGLMNGTTEQRTQSALAISDIVDRTSPDALKPFVTNITGPLIRVVSERSVDLKAAILLTLNNLLEKIPLLLKPFLPQLQRTFAKSLADPNSEVLRARAAKALGTLLTLKPRVDPLIAELITGSKTADPGVRNAMIKALYEVVSKAGETMGESSRNAILSLIDADTGEGSDDSMAITNARLLGVLVKVLPSDIVNSLVKQRALPSKATYTSALSLNSILLECPDVLTSNFAAETSASICQGMGHKTPAIADNFVLAAGKYMLHQGDDISFEQSKAVFELLANKITPGNPVDGRRLSLVVVRTMSRRHQGVVRPQIPLLAPPIFASLRDMVIPVKLAAEAAYLAMFDVVESESMVFDRYMAGAGSELPAAQKRSMQDHFKRVAMRLASQARERQEAEGGQGGLGLSKDEREDETEIWSIGKVELSDVFANE